MKNLVFVIFIVLSCTSYAQNYPPPYLAHSSNFMMTMFKVKAEAVKAFLPKEIEPITDEFGMANLGLEFYEVDYISGLPSTYYTSFIFVQVQGFETRSLPGHFLIWGVFSDSTAVTSYSKHYGFPFRYSEKFSLTYNGDTYTGIVGNKGKEIIKLSVTQNTEELPQEGIVNLISEKDNKIMYTGVPYITFGRGANKSELTVDPFNDPILELIQGVTPYWSMTCNNQNFCYTKPQIGKIPKQY